MVNSFDKVFMGAAGGVDLPSDDQFNRVSFLSHFDGANNGVNNAFDDGSTSNHTITAAGNVTQGSFGPFARPDGEWACEFSANGDTLNLGSSTDFNFAGDFSIEMFLMDSATDGVVFASHKQGVSTGYYFFNRPARLALHNEGDGFNLGNDNIQPVGVWYHLVISRQSGSMRVFIDGVLKVVVSNSSAITSSIYDFMIGGTINSSGNLDFTCNAKVSNFRIVNGSCATAYQTSSTTVGATIFTVPTGKLTAVTNTKLLTCQSNRFVDNSASDHTATPTGNAAVTAFGPFLTSAVYDAAVNGASAYFDGSGDYLQAANSADWDLGTGNFTWECYANINDITRTQWFFSVFTTASGDNAWGLRLESDGTLNAYFSSDGGESPTTVGVAAASSGLTENAWHHIACVRNGTGSNNIQVYVDGVSRVTGTFGAIYDTGLPFTVGRQMNTTYTQYFLGYISDVRIVKGTAVYTGNFTPPTAPLTAITNTKMLLNMADGQAIDSAAQNNLTLVGNAKISNTQAKFGDTSIYFDGTGDEAKYFSNGFGTGDFTMEAWVYPQTQPQRFPAVYYVTNGSSNRVAVQFDHDSHQNKFRCSVAGTVLSPTGTNAEDQWYHTAVVRYQGVVTFYIDGTSVGSTAYTHNVGPETAFFGGNTPISAELNFKGFIDDFRVSNTARYTANFTAPTAAFADKGQ